MGGFNVPIILNPNLDKQTRNEAKGKTLRKIYNKEESKRFERNSLDINIHFGESKHYFLYWQIQSVLTK